MYSVMMLLQYVHIKLFQVEHEICVAANVKITIV